MGANFSTGQQKLHHCTTKKPETRLIFIHTYILHLKIWGQGLRIGGKIARLSGLSIVEITRG
jgi:hypothetical protein